MTTVEAIERDKQRTEKTSVDSTGFIGSTVSLEDLIFLPLIAPAIVKGTRKRPRKHTTVYREAFGDSQKDSTAGIKHRRAGGIL
jgi:hypothetical protein